MSFYDGSIRILYVKISAAYVPVGCLTSNSLSEEVEMLPTTTRADGGWATARPTKQTGLIDFEGVQVLTTGESGDTTKASYDALKTLKRAGTLAEWKIEDGSSIFVDEGTGYITSLSEAAEIDGYLTFSGSIEIHSVV